VLFGITKGIVVVSSWKKVWVKDGLVGEGAMLDLLPPIRINLYGIYVQLK
jgi:hypothetical protein